MANIQIRGAKTHNLKNIDVDLPRDKLIVITGLSGSGKSSLAFDTIYAEGQRKYVESLSAYARQFLSMMEKPDVDSIEGLSPAISIEQKTTSHNPRSTVGTVTEVYDYLRLLFARTGTPYCPTHDLPLEAQTVSQMVDHTLSLPEETRLMLLAPMIRDRKGQHKNVLEQLQAHGYIRVRIDGTVYEIDEALDMDLDGKKKHTIEAVVDRFKVRQDLKQRLAESFETALELANGLALIAPLTKSNIEEVIFSDKYACPECGYSIPELEPKLFSFNSPSGACPTCEGLGVETFFDPEKIIVSPALSLEGGAIRGWDKRNAYYFAMIKSLANHIGFEPETPFNELSKEQQNAVLHGTGKEALEMTFPTPSGKKSVFKPFEGIIPNMKRRYLETDSAAVREELSKYQASRPCPSCNGTRLNEAARHTLVDGKNLPKLVELPVEKSTLYFSALTLEGAKGQIAEKIIKEIHDRLRFLNDVGLGYLSLDRSADTLSGGEAQRIRLASQIGSGLVGVMYILDEPSIGLHQRDNDRLLGTLTHLRNLGNTVIVVEHDEDAILAADYVLDIGPGAGVHGGQIIAQGTPAQIQANTHSLTGKYLSGKESIAVPSERRHFEQTYKLYGASGNNLQNVDVEIPVGVMTCITGVSGSGKSTLINETVYKHLANNLNRASHQVSPFTSDNNIEAFDKVVDIDQSPIGRTPRSNPATYTGLFTHIRELFAGTSEARSRGYKPGRFSFNVKGGRCEACQGDGVVKVEMHFLADVYVPCDVCKGKRYNRETLDVQYKGKNIYEVLNLTIEEAADFFAAVPAIANKLNTLMDVGLTYIKLGQSATTLSGGEAQRVKLARELSKRDTGKTIYILDEPTTGLHFADVKLLLGVLNRLVERGNTVVVIEHNLDVIKTADWVIDLGPEGGSGGGEIIACGTPEIISQEKRSHTGNYLKKLLK